jgi:hypothetical protein
MQPASVFTVRIGGLFTESGRLSDALGQINDQSLTGAYMMA